MWHSVQRLVGFCIFSGGRTVVRRTVVFLVTNFLFIAALVFSAEVILITLGVYDISLPLGQRTLHILTKLFF